MAVARKTKRVCAESMCIGHDRDVVILANKSFDFSVLLFLEVRGGGGGECELIDSNLQETRFRIPNLFGNRIYKETNPDFRKM